MDAVGPDLSLATLVGRISNDRACWMAFAKFASSVMLSKENFERTRQADRA